MKYTASVSERELGTIESTNAEATLPTSKKTKMTPNGPVVGSSWPKPKKRPVPITPAIWCGSELDNGVPCDLNRWNTYSQPGYDRTMRKRI
jgi:hypothetical protein